MPGQSTFWRGFVRKPEWRADHQSFKFYSDPRPSFDKQIRYTLYCSSLSSNKTACIEPARHSGQK